MTATVKVAPSLVKALQVIRLEKAVTPSAINAHMGNEYASKHICALRKLGFEFEVVKEGRKIVSYTLIVEPANVEEIRNPAPKAPKVAKEKAVKPAPKAKKAAKATEDKSDAKAKNLAKLKEVGKKQKKAKVVEVADEDEADESDVDVTAYHSIDPDFDTFAGIDLKALVG